MVDTGYINGESFSYAALLVACISSIYHLGTMAYNDIFTFSLVGMICIALNTLNSFIEYLTTAREEEVKNDDNETYDFTGYRPVPHPKQHRQLEDRGTDTSSVGLPEKELGVIATILEFCANNLATSFFSTDLFYAYQIFDADWNYIPLFIGFLNIFPALYVLDGVRQRDIFIYTIPANCWGQIFLVGIKQQNYYAAAAGYLFFLAFYYIHLQRSYMGMSPQAYANCHLLGYIIFATIALNESFAKFVTHDAVKK